MDTAYNCCEPGKGFFSSDERKWINKIRQLKEQFPDQVTITAEPETNNGCIVCQLPSDWFHLRQKKKHILSEEQILAATERLRAYREST